MSISLYSFENGETAVAVAAAAAVAVVVVACSSHACCMLAKNHFSPQNESYQCTLPQFHTSRCKWTKAKPNQSVNQR